MFVLSRMSDESATTADAVLHDLTYPGCVEFRPRFDRAKCLKCYDGDTITLGAVLSGYGPVRFSCRLLGIDTPELRSRDPSEKQLACIARDVLRGVLLHRLVSVEICGSDKYGRLLVRASTDIHQDVSEFIISQGLAVRYDGGKKPVVNWTDMLAVWRSKQMISV
jgi:endonuclease YncB( thermonuclease family)